ncbi:hypothetical protein Ciccas_012084 [Cichlidogyrus casuarinus]|uniref:Histidine ammonia-lyase n=1 Tax=Cichlidogyrus casuarinus TaxID=1844966 RepID=A0ABD2PSG6_9PLAT
MLFALRINALAKGYSGISCETFANYVDVFNKSCLSFVPSKGSVGASGDLAPLAHIALGITGEGQMWSPTTGWGHAKDVLLANGLKPISLQPKDGLSLINGTQFMGAIGAQALCEAENLVRTADVIAAMTLEGLMCSFRPYQERISQVRPHHGQCMVSRRLYAMLHTETNPSEIWMKHETCGKVQDAYSIRCIPQVHGVIWDTIKFVRGIISTEMNSATDNPLVFCETQELVSCGNFHGEYPAKALDYLCIAVHELASISERRIERMVNPSLSQLPAFLTPEGGLNSGFMMAHVTAAAVVSENKVLCHPSSIDSISTSAGQEDHVSMGAFAARKALDVVRGVEQVLAIELLCAAQAIDFHRPCKSTPAIEAAHALVRQVSEFWAMDRVMQPEVEKMIKLIREGKIWKAVAAHIGEDLFVL